MRCPVCAYPDMPYPPRDYNICPSCGTEFGSDDAYATHDILRARWVQNGAPWFFGQPPIAWNPYMQLMSGYSWEAFFPVRLAEPVQADNTVMRIVRPGAPDTLQFEMLAA